MELGWCILKAEHDWDDNDRLVWILNELPTEAFLRKLSTVSRLTHALNLYSVKELFLRRDFCRNMLREELSSKGEATPTERSRTRLAGHSNNFSIFVTMIRMLYRPHEESAITKE